MCKCGRIKSAKSCNNCNKTKTHSLGSSACEPGKTGDILFDGTEKECAWDEDFTMSTDESSNSILEKFFDRICARQQPMYFSSNNISEDFSEDWQPVTDMFVEIPAGGTGPYEVHAALNYKHATIDDVLHLIAEGEVTIGIDGTPISQIGLAKTLASQIPAASTTEASWVAPLFYAGTLTAGTTVQILIRSTDDTKMYRSIGGQLTVKPVTSVVVTEP